MSETGSVNLSKIYSKVPGVEGCKRGCTDCCGPVPCSEVEFEAIPEIPEKLSPVCDEEGERLAVCRFRTAIGCMIYEHRPLICRLFGAVNEPLLTCPHGAAARRLLSLRASRRLFDKVKGGEVIL